MAILAKLRLNKFLSFQVHVARGCSRHHEDDEATSDGRNHLQELDERADEDPGVQGAVLRPLHQAKRDQVGRGLQRPEGHPSDQVGCSCLDSQEEDLESF